MGDPEEADHTKLTPRELYEKPPLYKEDPDLEVPYPLLCGEHVIRVGKTADAVIVLSKYRLFVKYKKSFTNIPVRLVEHLDARENVLIIHCKDGKTFKVKFSNDNHCQQWCIELHGLSTPPELVTEFFAFCFHAWCFSEKGDGNEAPGMAFLKPENAFEYSFTREFERLGFNIGNAWRVYTNTGFKTSATYPEQHIVPSEIVDDDIRKMCKFRSKGRFPSVVWRHPRNGAVIVRCGQPEVGVFNWRCKEDERLISSFLQACSGCSGGGPHQPPAPSIMNGHAGSSSDIRENNLTLGKPNLPSSRKVLIVDLRSYTAAYGNKLKGGGWEYEEYYETSETIFMGLVNIHSIRKSFQGLRTLCSSASESSSNWLSKLESTEWLNHLALLLKSAHLVVNSVHKEGRPTVIHCSDGWDRTSQVVALAEIMMDPYYRTLEGIQVLIEREWLDFGHQFATRCGHDTNDCDPNGRSPVFLQWLDCLHQLLGQFPTAFEFNETFLIKLAEHAYSCLFGTFLCNTKKERLDKYIQENTCSVWAVLHVDAMINTNFLYDTKTSEQVLYPSWNVCDLQFWSKMYLSDSWRSEVEDGSTSSHGDASTITSSPKMPRTRSFDDIHKTTSEENDRRGSFVETCSLARTSSDPNLSDLRLEEIVGTPPKGTFMLQSMIDEQTRRVKEVTENNLREDVERPGMVDNEQQERGDSNHVTENGFGGGEEDDGKSLPSMLQSVRREDVISELQMQSSTDTVTEDTTPNGINGVDRLCNGYHTEDLSVGCETTLTNGELAGHSENHLVLKKSSNISTSTSDISSSHIEGVSRTVSRPRGRSSDTSKENGLSLHGSRTLLKIKTTRSDHRQQLPGGSKEDNSLGLLRSYSFSGPRSPSSGVHCPLPRRLDEDGLTNVTTASHKRILEVIVQSEQEKEQMQAEIERLREQLVRYEALDSWHDYMGVPERPLSSELGSNLVVEEDELKPSSVPNSLHSDTSWEQLDDREPGQTLWVPDHAVTQCQQCGHNFGIITRRHHCRSCGHIFCSTCSNYYTAIPREQLYHPQRVCRDCHDTLQEEQAQPTAAGSRLCSSETSLEIEGALRKVVPAVGQG